MKAVLYDNCAAKSAAAKHQWSGSHYMSVLLIKYVWKDDLG